MNEKVVETFDLTKIFELHKKNKTLKAVNNVNFDVRKGEILGLLGPNGAGKTTTIELLCTLKRPTSGTAKIYGYDVIKHKNKVKSFFALMLSGKMTYVQVTGYENLLFFSKIYGIKNHKEKIFQLAKEFGLQKWLDEYVNRYSKGMRMKLALIRTLLLDSPLLILDEPTHGLDPKVTKFLIQKIKMLKEEEKTILLTTHRMHVANELCDRIAFIKNGKIVGMDTTDNLKKLITDKLMVKIEVKENRNELINDLNSQNFVENIIPENNGFVVSITNNSHYPRVFEIVKNYKILKFKEIEPSLNDVFTTLL